MPINKNFLLELAIFISVVFITSHLTTHLWDRHFLRRELCNMRSSLHSLKNNLIDLGTAYDSLNTDVKEIVKLEHCKSCCQSSHRDLDRRRQHDVNVLSILNEKKKVCKGLQTRDNTVFNKYCLSRNASTITRYPLKSTGVGIATRQYRVYSKGCPCKNANRKTWKV